MVSPRVGLKGRHWVAWRAVLKAYWLAERTAETTVALTVATMAAWDSKRVGLRAEMMGVSTVEMTAEMLGNLLVDLKAHLLVVRWAV